MMTLLSHFMTLHILSFHKNFAMTANLMLMTLLRHSHLWKQITSQDLQDHRIPELWYVQAGSFKRLNELAS